jgi:hypothetical protein
MKILLKYNSQTKMTQQVVYVPIITHGYYGDGNPSESMMVGVFTNERKAYHALFKKLAEEDYLYPKEEVSDDELDEQPDEPDEVDEDTFNRFLTFDPLEDSHTYDLMLSYMQENNGLSKQWSFVVNAGYITE